MFMSRMLLLLIADSCLVGDGGEGPRPLQVPPGRQAHGESLVDVVAAVVVVVATVVVVAAVVVVVPGTPTPVGGEYVVPKNTEATKEVSATPRLKVLADTMTRSRQ
jgi:hypothetical protein